MNGQTIATIRKFYALHQSQLAEMLNVSQSYIAHLESGNKAVSKSISERISKVLELTPDKLAMILAAHEAYEATQQALNGIGN